MRKTKHEINDRYHTPGQALAPPLRGFPPRGAEYDTFGRNQMNAESSDANPALPENSKTPKCRNQEAGVMRWGLWILQ